MLFIEHTLHCTNLQSNLRDTSLLYNPAFGSPGTERRLASDTHTGLRVGDAEAGEIQYDLFSVGIYSWPNLAEKTETRCSAVTGNL